MKRRRVKRISEDVIREMLELYTMRPPFRIKKVKKKEEPDKVEKDAPRENKNQ